MADHRMLAGSLPWYAVDALEPEERSEVERHLEQCADCRAQLAEIREFAALSQGTAMETALEHVAPSLLVEYADAPQGLDPQVRELVERRLARCTICRDALERLRSISVSEHVQEELEARTSVWERIFLPLLRPAPALAYLAIAALGWTLFWIQPGGSGGPIVPGQVVTLDGERSLRDSGSAAQAAAWTLLVERKNPRPVLIELQTELDEVDLATEGLGFALELEREGRSVWTRRPPAGAFVFRQGRAALPVILDPGTMDAEVDYRISIRVTLPGDPLDGQVLFTRKLTISRKKSV